MYERRRYGHDHYVTVKRRAVSVLPKNWKHSNRYNLKHVGAEQLDGVEVASKAGEDECGVMVLYRLLLFLLNSVIVGGRS